MRALFPDAAALDGRGTTTLRELRAELVRTRQRGFAVEDGEITAGFASVAVAVTDRAGWPVASLAVTFESGAVDGARREELVAAVRRYASELRRRLVGG